MARLETQVTRYRTAAETLEKSEDELKVEKRKLQREVKKKEMQYTFYSLVFNLIKMRSQLREVKQLFDESDAARRTLQRQYDKFKAAR